MRALIFLAAAAAALPWPDTPYEEDVSSRYVAKSATPVYGWGQLPVDHVFDARGGILGSTEGTFVLGEYSLLFFAFYSDPQQVTPAADLVVTNITANLHLPFNLTGYKLVVDMATGSLAGLASPGGLAALSCSENGCEVLASLQSSWEAVTGAERAPWANKASTWVISTASGAYTVENNGKFSAPAQIVSEPTLSLALNKSQWLNPQSMLGDSQAPYILPGNVWGAIGSASKMYYLLPTSSPTPSLAVGRWDWTTEVWSGSGGVFDDVLLALAFDGCGALWVATPTCIDVMHANGTVDRISGLQGLPFNHTSSLAVDGAWTPGKGFKKGGSVWVGTSEGVARFVPSSADGCFSAEGSRVGMWRYYWGNRYLPLGNEVLGITTWSSPARNASVETEQGQALVWVVGGGAARVVHQWWRLADKAAHYAQITPRHDRFGFTADCGLPSLGNTSALECSAGESDGLWTGIMLAGEAAEAALTHSPEALDRVSRRVDALLNLFRVTGIPGYPARTMAPLNESSPGSNWFNSPSLSGWRWMGDTSADSYTGDLFGLTAALSLVGNLTGQEERVREVLNESVSVTIANGFRLLGHDGQPTRWGHWEPALVNDDRDWSDQRGLNALQMLSYLSLATGVTGDPDGRFWSAWNELTNATNQYGVNVVNEEIEAPIDDNYSDLELAFLPFWCFLAAPFNESRFNPLPHRPDFALLGLARSWSHIIPLRSSLWNVIFLASALSAEAEIEGDGGSDGGGDDALGWAVGPVMESTVWNLQTWPLELITWGTSNTQRTDIRFNPEPDRDGHYHTQTVRVLPCNERSQYRWNANAFKITNADDGMREFDPGAWLAPYWLARYHGLLA